MIADVRTVHKVAIRLEVEREIDGRWIAENLEMPGALCYGASPETAIAKALRLTADRIEADGLERARFTPAACK